VSTPRTGEPPGTVESDSVTWPMVGDVRLYGRAPGGPARGRRRAGRPAWARTPGNNVRFVGGTMKIMRRDGLGGPPEYAQAHAQGLVRAHQESSMREPPAVFGLGSPEFRAGDHDESD
jgi:hypothetical protein